VRVNNSTDRRGRGISKRDMITFILVWALRPRLDGTKQSVDLDRPGAFGGF
jgi:hypothetical protein